MAIGGVVTVLLGAFLVWMLPHTGLMVPGLFLAVDLLSYRFALLATGFARTSQRV